MNPNTFPIIMEDFLFISSSTQAMTKIFRRITTKYKMKRLWPLASIFQLQVPRRLDKSVHISQHHVIVATIRKLNMTDCNPKPSPLPKSIHWDIAAQSPPVDTHMTQTSHSVLADLRYVTNSTRPGIRYAVNRLAETMHTPSTSHWQQMPWLLRYPKNSNVRYVIPACTTNDQHRHASPSNLQ